MPRVTIDRLSLHLSGITESDGRSLTRLIAEGLADASLPSGGGQMEWMQSSVAASPGASPATLSERIVADLVRQLARSI
jgi:hypothetical protein